MNIHSIQQKTGRNRNESMSSRGYDIFNEINRYLCIYLLDSSYHCIVVEKQLLVTLGSLAIMAVIISKRAALVDESVTIPNGCSSGATSRVGLISLTFR